MSDLIEELDEYDDEYREFASEHDDSWEVKLMWFIGRYTDVSMKIDIEEDGQIMGTLENNIDLSLLASESWEAFSSWWGDS